MKRPCAAAFVLALAACKSEASDLSGTVTLSFGPAGAPVLEPPPSRVTITARTTTGATRDVGTFGWPPPATVTVATSEGEGLLLTAAAVTDAGTIPMRAETPFVSGDELADGTVVLLFGPTSGAVTAPTPLPRGASAAKGALVLGRYALAAEGKSTVLWDSATLRTRMFVDLPAAPLTLGTWGVNVLVVVDQGSASLLDLASGGSSSLSIDTAAVAGGRAVTGSDGLYLVGPTRAADSAVVVALRDATTTIQVAARHDASAAWVNDAGLVLAGGSAGTVDVLAPGATAFQTKVSNLAPAPLVVVAPLGNLTAALVGGGQKTRLVSLACSSDCVKELDAVVDVKNGEAFQVGNSAFVFGEDTSGHAVAHLLRQDGSTKPVPLATARKGATAVALGDGYVAVLGGTDDAGAPVLSVELFTPP